MFSFRKKVLFVHIVLFLLCLALFFPLVERVVNHIAIASLKKRAAGLIGKIQKAPDLDRMIEYLRTEKEFVFFRITLFDRVGQPIYDTHVPILDNAEHMLNEPSPEIVEAIKYGHGHGNRYSTIFRQSIVYSALSFDAHGQEYVLRIGLPFNEIHTLTLDFEIGFVVLGIIILVLYGGMILMVIHRLSRPIQQIISAIRPYQEGREEFIPRIELGKEIQARNEFGKLAKTFNALNERIQKQIANLVEQQERTKEILESLGEGVIAVDRDGSVTFANPAAAKMLGVPCESFLNQKFNETHAQRSGLYGKCQELIGQAIEREEITVQTYRVEEMPPLYFDLIAAPLAQHDGIILVLQDKTSDYEVVEMGKDFIANASHELRTPITVICGFAETLHDVPNLSPSLIQEITEKIFKTCMRLDALVKSLLTLADIENISASQFHFVDLTLVAENCKQLIQIAHPKANIGVQRKVPQAMILADANLLEMAVMNLLENAIKYSPAPAQIHITVDSIEGQAQFKVKDCGIGIPEADLPRIFDRFYTVDKARSRRFGGTGLGLSIVKTIVRKHQGDISVASQLGQGSTFTIRLPLHE